MSDVLSPQRPILRHAAWLAAALLLFISIASLHAQTDANNPPLIVLAAPMHSFDLDLFAYTGGEWQRLTTDGCKSGLHLSPDGSQVVYRTAPWFACGSEADAAGTSYLVGAGWDVMLYDLTTGESRTLAGQPDGLTLPDVHGAVTRSLPVWSPDGTSLAWTEQDYAPQQATRLVVADAATGEQRVLDSAVPQMGLSANGLPVFFTWGAPAIVVFTSDPDDGAETLRIYDPAGGEPRVIRMPDDMVDEWYPQSDMIWVQDGDHDVLLVEAASAIWYAVDVASGQVSPWASKLILEPVSGASNALSLTWNPFAVEDKWQLVSADGAVLQSWQPDAVPQQFAIAPSGPAVAYLDYGSLYLWRDDASARLALPDDLYVRDIAWGATRWQAGEVLDAIG